MEKLTRSSRVAVMVIIHVIGGFCVITNDFYLDII
jgi:hypothetical protein